MKHIARFVVIAVFSLGMMSASMQQAEAGRGGRIFAGAVLGALALGVLHHHHHHYGGYHKHCYKGPRRCHKHRRCWYKYGKKRCNYKRHCHRRTYCD